MYKILITLFLCWFSFSAMAIDSGRVTVYSVPDEPLVAEIDILSVIPKGSGSLVVKLASRDDFAKENLAYPDVLDALDFSFARNEETGEVYIKVSSMMTVHQANLPFIIEASWGSGRLLRRYNAVIDPNQVLQTIQTENNSHIAIPNTQTQHITNMQAQPAEERRPVVKPEPITPKMLPKEEKSGISLMTIGPILIIIIIGVFLLRLRGKKTQNDELDEDQQATDNIPFVMQEQDNVPTEIVDQEQVKDSYHAEHHLDETVLQEEEEDFFSHINELILLGAHDEAEQLLEEALNTRGEDQEVKQRLQKICLELLDIYYEDQNDVAFLRQAQKLSYLVEKDDPIWQKVLEWGTELCPAHALFKEQFKKELLEETQQYEDSVSDTTVDVKKSELNLEKFINQVENNRTAVEKILPKDGVKGKKEEDDNKAAMPDTDVDREVEVSKIQVDIAKEEDKTNNDMLVVENEEEVETKLELAKAYLEMEDIDSAGKILQEVAKEGNTAQRIEAQALLDEIS